MSVQPDEQRTISVSDAIRLKNEINQGIAWGNSNLNALQVEKLTTLSAEDYARIRADYRKWNASMNVVSSIVLAAVTLACVVGYFYFPYWWLRVISGAFGIGCFYTLAKRDGNAKGYIEGYTHGYESGIHKALGIRPEELREMHEYATDMKIDAMLIEKMDEREQRKKE